MKRLLILCLLVLFGGVYTNSSADDKKLTPTKNQKNLWSEWYSVRVADIKYATYLETFEEKGDQIQFQTEMKKNEEGFINEEQMGAIARNTPMLEPLFYNLHRTYRASELVLDGSVVDSLFSVKIRKDKKDLPVIKKYLPKNAIFSVFFPVWLKKNSDKFKKIGDSQAFHAVMEDDLESGFGSQAGRAYLQVDDELATRTKTQKFKVDIGNRITYWWVLPSGAAERIEMPSQNTVVQRITAQEAQKFLKPD